MNLKSIIDSIEQLTSNYNKTDSEETLYRSTKQYLSQLREIDVVNDMLACLKSDYPYPDKTLEELSQIELFEVLDMLPEGFEQFTSYMLHYLDWRLRKPNDGRIAYHACWTYSLQDDDVVSLFKDGIVRHITSFLLRKLKEMNTINETIEQYRVEILRFGLLKDSHKEEDAQNKLSKFFFDKGIRSIREEYLEVGKPDFTISTTDNNIIVEVKYIGIDDKGKDTPSFLNACRSQLQTYMDLYTNSFGVLCMVSEKELYFKFEKEPRDMIIENIYIGDKKPSEKAYKYIEI